MILISWHLTPILKTHLTVFLTAFLVLTNLSPGQETPAYKNLTWQNDNLKQIIYPNGKPALRLRTIPDRNDLLDIDLTATKQSGATSTPTISIDTHRFYAQDILKKEVILYLTGDLIDNCVKLQPGQIRNEQINVYQLQISGDPGAEVGLLYVGRRSEAINKGHFRIDKVFVLDGTIQTLEHQLAIPADVESFSLRLDLKSPGKYSFSTPKFLLKTNPRPRRPPPGVNYILNGGAEKGFDQTIYIPLQNRTHPAYNAFVNWKGEKEDFVIELERDTEIVRSGKYAFRLRFSGTGVMTSRVDSFAFNPVPLLLGEMYTYSVWAKAERPGSIELGLYLGNGVGINCHRQVGTEWTELLLHIPVWGEPGADFKGRNYVNSPQQPAGVVVPTIVIPPNNTVWFDDASVFIGQQEQIGTDAEITAELGIASAVDNSDLIDIYLKPTPRPNSQTETFFRRGRLDRLHQYYYAGEKINVDLQIESVAAIERQRRISYQLRDVFGLTVDAIQLGQLTLPSNQEVNYQFSFVPPVDLRGPINLIVEIALDDGEVVYRNFYLGIIDPPDKLNRRFSLEVPAMQNITQIVPFFHDFTIGAARVGSASGKISHALESVKYLHDAGIEVMMNYSVMDKKAEKGDRIALEGFLNDFHHDLRKYRDYLTIIESHNEANIGMTSVVWNAEVIKEMRKIIDQEAPHIKFAGPDPCGTDFAWIQGVLAAGGAEALDIVTEHPYRKLPEQPDYGADVAAVRKIIDYYRPGLPHYATESGRVNPSILPDNLIYNYIRQAAARDIRNMLLGFGEGLGQYNQFAISSWQIAVGWNSLFMGNKDTDGAQLPGVILFAMRNAADRLGTGKPAGRVKLGYNYRCYLFDRGDSRILTLWNFHGAAAKFTLPSELADKIHIYDMVGTKLLSTAAFNVGEYPVYLESTLSVNELEQAILSVTVDEEGGKNFLVEAKVVSPDRFAVSVQNLTVKRLTDLTVRILDVEEINSQVEQYIDSLALEEVQTVEFELKRPVDTQKRQLRIVVVEDNHGNSRREEVTLNLAALVIPKSQGKIVVDGNLADWDVGSEVVLSKENAIVLAPTLWDQGADQIVAHLRYAWDDHFFYLAATVEKNAAQTSSQRDNPGNMWNYDSLQICFDPLSNGKAGDHGFSDDDFEYSLGLVDGQAVVYRRTGSSAVYDSLHKAPGVVEDVKFALRQESGRIIYEAAFPRQAISPFQLRVASQMRSSVIVNIRQSEQRIGYLELTPGIGDAKSPGKWLDTVLVE